MLKWNAAESKYVAEQKEHLQMEVLELRQRCQNELQCLEKRLMSGEHSVRRTQLETAEQYKMSHHNSAREQALNHFNECASMKKRHLQVQHESELNNQTDYTRQAQVELKKQHGLKQKNLPRELKVCLSLHQVILTNSFVVERNEHQETVPTSRYVFNAFYKWCVEDTLNTRNKESVINSALK